MKNIFLLIYKGGTIYIKSGENEGKTENSAFSSVNCSLKMRSRQETECMDFEGNFLGFQNIKSDFL